MSTDFITFCWGAFLLYALILLWQKMAVNLHAAQKKTDSRADMKHYSSAFYYHATHELLLTCSARKIACMQYIKVDLRAAHFVSHACFDSSHDKYCRKYVCSPHTSVNLNVSCTLYATRICIHIKCSYIYIYIYMHLKIT